MSNKTFGKTNMTIILKSLTLKSEISKNNFISEWNNPISIRNKSYGGLKNVL